MFSTIVAALTVLLMAGAAALFIAAQFMFWNARKTLQKAKARFEVSRNDLIAAKLLEREFKRGFESRNGEMKWYALKWQGENERANEYEMRVRELEGFDDEIAG